MVLVAGVFHQQFRTVSCLAWEDSIGNVRKATQGMLHWAVSPDDLLLIEDPNCRREGTFGAHFWVFQGDFGHEHFYPPGWRFHKLLSSSGLHLAPRRGAPGDDRRALLRKVPSGSSLKVLGRPKY